MKDFLAAIGMMALGIIIVIPVYFLGAYIIKDVAQLYHIGFIAVMSKEMIVGLLIIKNIITYPRPKKEDESNDTSEAFKKILKGAFIMTLGILLYWGVAYIIYVFI